MRLIAVTMMFAITSLVASCAMAQEPVDYRTAYHKAQDGQKPLLVFVSADWCPPCQVMKKTTLPQLLKKESFAKFHFSTLDLDKDEAIGRQLIGTQGIPQFVMFEKEGDKWVRRNLVGIQTPEAVEAFLAQANRVRLAAHDQNDTTERK